MSRTGPRRATGRIRTTWRPIQSSRCPSLAPTRHTPRSSHGRWSVRSSSCRGRLASGRFAARPPVTALAGADSVGRLREAWQGVRDLGWELANADVGLIREEPRLAPHRYAMRVRLASALDVEPVRVTVRATTTDGLGFTGRREGLAAQAVALLQR